MTDTALEAQLFTALGSKKGHRRHALDTGARVSEVWFADATERRSAIWGISEDMKLALIGTGWRDLSRR
jgi:hypothetical protein